MTFSASVPLNSDSPSLFPAQNQTNMARLQTLVGADHQFNLTAAANDGYHNLIHKTVQAPAGALAATGRSYVKTSAGRIHDFYMDDTGAEYQITPTMPIRAAVNFDKAGNIRSEYNVGSITDVATGSYTINFTTAMPDTNYIVLVTGMRDTTGRPIIGCVRGDPTYANSVTTDWVKVRFFGVDNVQRDIVMGNVVIMSVT